MSKALVKCWTGMLLAAWVALVPAARAADTIVVGSVGAASANLWPVYIGMTQKFFEKEELNVDLVFAQSNASVLQQLTAGSMHIAISAGLVDPIRAIEKGGAVAIVRLELQAPPYGLLGKKGLKGLGDLKGRKIIVGGAKDITRVFVERMLAPNGVQPGEVDWIYAGSTSARFAALQSGAVDAAILLPPFNFRAEGAGFVNLGFVIDYVKDIPFAGTVVHTPWANANRQAVRKFLSVYTRSIAWFYDERNRREAVDLMVKVSSTNRDDTEKTYDFLSKGRYFEPTGRVSRTKLRSTVQALRDLGDLERPIEAERLVLPGVAELAD
jgi:ABC-type nitrate/sulfonate/bicarbonate transport system substrate-binding protein